MTNVYLTGNFAPVGELTAFDLPVVGEIPPSLRGRVIRNGANPTGNVDEKSYHWFTGTGMVHGVRLRDGRAEWYRSRYVRDDLACAAQGWDPLPGPRSVVGAVNTHVFAVGGETLAAHEGGPLPVRLSYDLESVAHVDLAGGLDGEFTAHLKRDPATGVLHGVTYRPDRDGVRYITIGPDGRLRRAVSIAVPERIEVHDCAITATHVAIFDLPLTLDASLAASGSQFPYRWNPDHQARIGLLRHDGQADEVEWFELDPCFVYHPLNAYDAADGAVVLDVTKHPSTMAVDLNGPMDGPPTLDRFTLDPSSGKALTERLDDRPQEFPTIDERLTGREHRYGYTVSFDPLGALVKHDLLAGRADVRDFGPGRAAQEAVFIPREPTSGEDEGWLMTFVHDALNDRSDLVILAADDFTGEAIATIKLPRRVPFGFHGSWIPDAVTTGEGS